MIEFEVKSRKLNIGKRKGQTVYYASPKAKQHFTNKMVIDRIVRETSLSAGDVSNALISLGAIVRDALLMGSSIDLADLGSFRVIVPPKMIDNEIDVCVETLKTPKIVFTPKMQMREAAKNVELSVDNPKRKKKKEGKKPGGSEGGNEHP
ncbi:DNA-binding protein [Prevotella intermedia]|uniref:DNA-binding protein n=1 Tax=Prevotella intermedia TaxID=28131 RepID=A0A0H5BKY2_PREIN|nr:HU family DNA-binding protein [Prevotella intermedia]AFJ09691.1 putative DNA-binding protein [Prevotella intermedia 17]APW34547.1 DNA-binding protein [Prevotella intermedia]ATV55422.1 DNA-binding protein [Prevotella intermedia]PJI19612.1 DNA-binding protein [Prevotella intermedia]BAR95759.1 DNA-binding protein [Prevotella intermedia]